MPRIRTIKPQFWTDSAVLACTRDSRLLFLGLLNFADDKGNIEADPIMIKALIFPADDIDVTPLLNELEQERFLIPYSVDEKQYFNIRNFLKHQVINRPSPHTNPLPPWQQHTQGGLNESSLMEKDKEGEEEKELKIVKQKNNQQTRMGSRNQPGDRHVDYPEKHQCLKDVEKL